MRRRDLAEFYRLRPGVRHPAFRAGELYQYVRDDGVPGHIFVELDGKPRGVCAGDFQEVKGGACPDVVVPED